jgi:hypothetical protein
MHSKHNISLNLFNMIASLGFWLQSNNLIPATHISQQWTESPASVPLLYDLSCVIRRAEALPQFVEVR